MTRLVGFVGVACLALAGCGSSSDSGTATDGQTQTTVDSFCTSLAEALATRAANCSGGPIEAWRVLFNPASPDSLCAEFREGIAGSRLRFDPSKAQGCLDAVQNSDCATLLAGAEPAACDAAATGLVAAGGNCFSDSECAGEAFCNTDETCPGACVAFVPENGACGDTTPGCVVGTSCVAGTCTRTSGLNGPCGENQPECQADLGCFGDPSTTTGTCQPLQTSGPCPTGFECAVGFACAGAPGAEQCVAAKKLGEACTADANDCELLTSCSGGTCKVYPKLGEACDPTGESNICLEGFCDPAGTCAPLKAEGASCQFDEECASFACELSACAPVCKAP